MEKRYVGIFRGMHRGEHWDGEMMDIKVKLHAGHDISTAASFFKTAGETYGWELRRIEVQDAQD